MIRVYFGSGLLLTPHNYMLSNPKTLTKHVTDLIYKDASIPVYSGRNVLRILSIRAGLSMGYVLCVGPDFLVFRKFGKHMVKHRLVTLHLRSLVLRRDALDEVISGHMNRILASFPSIRGDLFRALLTDKTALRVIVERHRVGSVKTSGVLARVWEYFPYKFQPLTGDCNVVDTTTFSK